METCANILYRLARFLAGVPPEVLGGTFLLVLERPDIIAAVLSFILSAVAGNIVVWLLGAVFAIYVWRKLPPRIRRDIRRAIAKILPDEVSRYAGIMPGYEPSGEDENVDSLNSDRVPKAWLNQRVEIEFNLYRDNPDDIIKTYGDVADVNDQGVVIKTTYNDQPGGRSRTETTFHPWTSIKGMTIQIDPLDDMTDEEFDEYIDETIEQ